MKLKGSKTEKNLKDAFAGESQANRRYLYFADKADVEGYNDVSAVFRSTAEGETGHAHGHLEYLEAVGDPATGLPIGATNESQGGHRRRNPRVHGHVPGHGEGGARRRIRRDRRLVRDARQGRALARQPLPEGARHDLATQPRGATCLHHAPLCRARVPPGSNLLEKHRKRSDSRGSRREGASRLPRVIPSTGAIAAIH